MWRGEGGATVREKARNVIPTVATASIDLRLLEGNDAIARLNLVEGHIRNQGYHIVRQDPDEGMR